MHLWSPILYFFCSTTPLSASVLFFFLCFFLVQCSTNSLLLLRLFVRVSFSFSHAYCCFLLLLLLMLLLLFVEGFIHLFLLISAWCIYPSSLHAYILSSLFSFSNIPIQKPPFEYEIREILHWFLRNTSIQMKTSAEILLLKEEEKKRTVTAYTVCNKQNTGPHKTSSGSNSRYAQTHTQTPTDGENGVQMLYRRIKRGRE